MFTDDFHSNGEGNGEEHTDTAPHPAPEDQAEKDDEGGEIERASGDAGFEDITDHHLNKGQDGECSEGEAVGVFLLEEGDDHGGDDGDDGADIGDEIEKKGGGSPEHIKIDAEEVGADGGEDARQ